MKRYRNPLNNMVETVESPGPWCLLFGPFYFLRHSAWEAAVISGLAAFLTFGISWLIVPFFAESLIRISYIHHGWEEL